MKCCAPSSKVCRLRGSEKGVPAVSAGFIHRLRQSEHIFKRRKPADRDSLALAEKRREESEICG